MSNNFVVNSVAFSAFSTQNPISIPRYNVNDYVKHVFNQSKREGESEGVGRRGVVINVDPTRFSYFSSTLPAYLVGWEDGDECWVSAGSIRKLRFVETKPEYNGGFSSKETPND